MQCACSHVEGSCIVCETMTDRDVEANNKAPPETQQQQQQPPSSMLSAGSSSLRDVESVMASGIFDSVGSKYTSENYRRAVGASYVLTMSVSGIVLVALASSLSDLAHAMDKTSVQVRRVHTYSIVVLSGSI